MCEISVEFATVLLDSIYNNTHNGLMHEYFGSTLEMQNCKMFHCVDVAQCVHACVDFLSSALSTKIANTATKLECLVHVLGNFIFKHMLYAFTCAHSFRYGNYGKVFIS